MANSAGLQTSFKVDILQGKHNFGVGVVRGSTAADVFNMALMLASGSLSPATATAYSPTSELAATGNYTAGGNPVTNATPPSTSGTTAVWTPSASVTWSNLTSSGTFDTAWLYNATAAGKNGVALFALGAQSITAGTLTLTMPAALLTIA